VSGVSSENARSGLKPDTHALTLAFELIGRLQNDE